MNVKDFKKQTQDMSSIKRMNEQIASLKAVELRDRQARRVFEKGTIQNISPQGDRLYVTVQRIPQTVIARDGTVEVIAGIFFGNEFEHPDDEITMTELLMETDVDLSVASTEVKSFIGREVTVEMINNSPHRVLLQSPLLRPRTIPPTELAIARLQSVDGTLKGNGAEDYLLNMGYKKEEIEASTAETLESITKPEIDYGVAQWQNVGPTEGTEDMTKSAEGGIVTGLPLASNDSSQEAFCFKPNKALTAK